MPNRGGVPFPSLLGVARSAGWGMARCFNLESDCTGAIANLSQSIPAIHTPSAAPRRLPRFAEKGCVHPPEQVLWPAA